MPSGLLVIAGGFFFLSGFSFFVLPGGMGVVNGGLFMDTAGPVVFFGKLPE
jgi:hypothetical protein